MNLSECRSGHLSGFLYRKTSLQATLKQAIPVCLHEGSSVTRIREVGRYQRQDEPLGRCEKEVDIAHHKKKKKRIMFVPSSSCGRFPSAEA